MTSVAIPNRPVFRAQEVCELADVQPYVLRTWEAEFPDLGASKTVDGPRVYRRADVERVLRIKDLLFVEGLTLAGARRRLTEEGVLVPPAPVEDADVAAMMDVATQQHLRDVRRGLQWILGVLSGNGGGAGGEDFVLSAAPAAARGARKTVGQARPAKAGAARVAKKPGKKK